MDPLLFPKTGPSRLVRSHVFGREHGAERASTIARQAPPSHITPMALGDGVGASPFAGIVGEGVHPRSLARTNLSTRYPLVRSVN